MSTREELLTQTISLIENINVLHRLHSEEWYKNTNKRYNLKRTQVSDICKSGSDIGDGTNIVFDFDFIIYMNEYCELLNKVHFHAFYDFLDLDGDLNLTSRIKDPDSRISKIRHYRFFKNEKGKVNLNKCLNDLMGFRILVDDFAHDDYTIDTLKQSLAKSRIRVHNSCKGDYKATHVYFNNGNNIYFPWELQIWNKSDFDNNIRSHAIHKQAYTEWPSVYGNY